MRGPENEGFEKRVNEGCFGTADSGVKLRMLHRGIAIGYSYDTSWQLQPKKVIHTQIKSFFSFERHRDLVGIVRQEGQISMAQLISESAASPATLCRDVNYLLAEGTLWHVRFGVFWPENPPIETPHERRLGSAREQKQAIVREAARMVPPHAGVFIASGTMCAAGARPCV